MVGVGIDTSRRERASAELRHGNAQRDTDLALQSAEVSPGDVDLFTSSRHVFTSSRQAIERPSIRPSLVWSPKPRAPSAGFSMAELQRTTFIVSGQSVLADSNGTASVFSRQTLDRSLARRLTNEQREFLEGSDCLFSRPETPLDQGPVSVSLGTRGNTFSLSVGRTLLLGLEDGSIIKVKGVGAGKARSVGRHEIVKRLLPKHLPYGPIDSTLVPTWSNYFFGESADLAVQNSVQGGVWYSWLISTIFPELDESVPRPIAARVSTSVPDEEGRPVSYFEALGSPREYLKNGEFEHYKRMMAVLAEGIPESEVQIIASAAAAYKVNAIRTGKFEFPVDSGQVASVEHTFYALPGYDLDYARDVVAVGGADLISEREYIDGLFLAGLRLLGRPPGQSVTWEPSRFRNTASDWVQRPELIALAQGVARLSLPQQAEWIVSQIRDLYRLAGGRFPADLTLELSEVRDGVVSGRKLAQDICAQDPGEALKVLRSEASKLAKTLAALLAGSVGFGGHKLQRKDFIGGVVTDFTDLGTRNQNGISEVGRVLVQSETQIEAMGAVIGLPAADIEGVKVEHREWFRLALERAIRMILRWNDSDPSAGISSEDKELLLSNILNWRVSLLVPKAELIRPGDAKKKDPLHSVTAKYIAAGLEFVASIEPSLDMRKLTQELPLTKPLSKAQQKFLDRAARHLEANDAVGFQRTLGEVRKVAGTGTQAMIVIARHRELRVQRLGKILEVDQEILRQERTRGNPRRVIDRRLTALSYHLGFPIDRIWKMPPDLSAHSAVVVNGDLEKGGAWLVRSERCLKSESSSKTGHVKQSHLVSSLGDGTFKVATFDSDSHLVAVSRPLTFVDLVSTLEKFFL